ncbi:MAG: hypothetical protein U0903_12740 [Planctomycetales bacterium]
MQALRKKGLVEAVRQRMEHLTADEETPEQADLVLNTDQKKAAHGD